MRRKRNWLDHVTQDRAEVIALLAVTGRVSECGEDPPPVHQEDVRKPHRVPDRVSIPIPFEFHPPYLRRLAELKREAQEREAREAQEREAREAQERTRLLLQQSRILREAQEAAPPGARMKGRDRSEARKRIAIRLEKKEQERRASAEARQRTFDKSLAQE